MNLQRERLEVQFEALAPANRDDRTATLTWYTGAAVRRYDGRGPFEMRFSMETGAVRMGRLASGSAPLLNSHRDFTVDDVIGVINTAWVENGHGKATVRFSKRADVDTVWQDVQDGILRNASMGVAIHAVEEVTPQGAAMRQVLVTDWEPEEVSLRTVSSVSTRIWSCCAVMALAIAGHAADAPSSLQTAKDYYRAAAFDRAVPLLHAAVERPARWYPGLRSAVIASPCPNWGGTPCIRSLRGLRARRCVRPAPPWRPDGLPVPARRHRHRALNRSPGSTRTGSPSPVISTSPSWIVHCRFIERFASPASACMSSEERRNTVRFDSFSSRARFCSHHTSATRSP